MIKDIICCVIAIMFLTACADVPENLLESKTSFDTSDVSDDSSTYSSPTAEKGPEGMVCDTLENAFSLDLTGKKHIKASRDMKINKPNIDGIYETSFNSLRVDLSKYQDEFGKYYFGDEYDSTAWTARNDGMEHTDLREYFYKPEGFNGQFHVSNNSCMSVIKDREKFSPAVGDTEIIEDDGTEYPLFDGNSITYAEAVKAAEQMVKGYDTILGKETSDLAEVRYCKENKSILVDYSPKVYGLKFSTIMYDVSQSDNWYDGLNLAWGFGNFRKHVYVYGVGDGGASLTSAHAEFETPIKAKHDKMITLQSALDLLDERTAEYLHYEVESVDLTFLLLSEKQEVDPTDIKIGDVVTFEIKGGVPVWEVILKQTDSPKRYAYVVDTIYGERSLMRMKEIREDHNTSIGNG